MNVKKVRLRDFRNHDATEILFGSGINALFGNNGQGKTNVLEAISYLSLTKSFYATGDAIALQIGKEYFDVEGVVVSDSGIENTIRVAYGKPSGEKHFTVNGVRPETLASVIGRFPIVVLSPEKNAITFGGPAERRKFIDLLLSQMYPAYFEDLLEYRRVLRQRNRLLMDAKFGRSIVPEELAPWTESLIRNGSRIILARHRLIAAFDPYVKRAYQDLVRNGEVPGLVYKTIASGDAASDVQKISSLMSVGLAERAIDERKRGSTLVGPHRDDLVFTINRTNVQEYASQGQHKTLLVALKVAEFHYLSERREERPIFLLDDVFSELDERRSRHLLELVGSKGQTIITTTEESVFHGAVNWNGEHRKFYVEAGKVKPG